MAILLKNKTTPRDSYEEDFSAIGKECIFVPLLYHEHVGVDETCSYLESPEFERVDAIIITSHRAVEAINLHLENICEIAKTTLLSKPIYTVGPATAKVLRDAGYTDVRGAEHAGNGSILSDIIIQESSVNAQYVFFTGEIRRDIIPKRIAAAEKLSLEERVVYKTCDLEDIEHRFDLAFNQSHKEEKPWIVFFSPSGTQNIIVKLKSFPRESFQIAAIGPTTEKYLSENDLTPDTVAEKPTSQSLIEVLFHQVRHV